MYVFLIQYFLRIPNIYHEFSSTMCGTSKNRKSKMTSYFFRYLVL